MIKQKHIAYYNAKTDLYAVLASSGDMYVLNGDGTTEVAALKRSYGSGRAASYVWTILRAERSD